MACNELAAHLSQELQQHTAEQADEEEGANAIPLRQTSTVKPLKRISVSTPTSRRGSVHHYDAISAATCTQPPRSLATSQSAGTLSFAPSTVSFAAPHVLGSVNELEQTSEIKPQERRSRGVSRNESSRMGGLSCSSSQGSFAGGQLPILLPGKLQWVRDQHVKLETASKLSDSVELGSLNIARLPSELYFGKYEERIGKFSVAEVVRSQEALGPLAQDGFYSHANQAQRIGKERRAHWSAVSFDRIGSHFAPP